jgi:hypothetical protein
MVSVYHLFLYSFYFSKKRVLKEKKSFEERKVENGYKKQRS